MKAIRIFLAAVLLLGPFAALSAQQPAPAAADSQQWDEDPGWPRVLEQGDLTLTVYLPQVEKFEGDEFEARAAVQVETRVEGEEKPRTTYGVIWIQARTQIDKEAGLVHLDEIAIPRASFPGDPERTEDYLSIIRGQAESQRTISLARLQANLAIVQAEARGNAVPLKNDPPRVIYSTTPVLLVLVDGDPVLRPVEGSGLQRIVNTRALILSDGSRYFMPIMNRWLQAASLDAHWSFATPPPAAEAIRKSIAEDENQAQADLLTDPSDDVKALIEKGALAADRRVDLARGAGGHEGQAADVSHLGDTTAVREELRHEHLPGHDEPELLRAALRALVQVRAP